MFTLDSCNTDTKAPKVLELVAGEGDNYGATVAPRLGSPDAVKLDLPPMPTPRPAPQVQPAPAEPAPPVVKPVVEAPPPKVTPAPKPPPKLPVATKKEPDVIPNFTKQIKRKVIAAEWRARREVARERAAEEKRQKELERQRAAREKAAAAKSTPRVPHIDGKGIAKGVIGGSTENMTSGAGGRALVANEGAVTERYYALLKEKVRNALDKPAGLSDDLVATIDFHISASGRISEVQVVKSSGSPEWDRAVVAAFNRVTMPEHPEHKGEDLELDFRTKEAD